MKDEKLSEPSYGMAAIAGFFLGLLGMTWILLFKDTESLLWAVPPAVGLIAGVIGAYVAAEPYQDLKENYDRLMADLAEIRKEGKARILLELYDDMGEEASRLAREAAELGPDGEKIAEAAEFLRKQTLKIESEIKIND